MGSKLLIWVALGLLLANVQCVATCATLLCDATTSGGAMPPCHQHHPDSPPAKASACPNHTTIAPVPLAAGIPMPAMTTLAIPAFQHRWMESRGIQTIADPSPPPLTAVLRI